MARAGRAPRVAIACQGGGSHASFSAGVLLELLRPEHRRRYELVALSGTSGGAISAALAWRGLLASGVDEATERLYGFWRDITARDPLDAWIAFWDEWLASLPKIVKDHHYRGESIAEPALSSLRRSL